MNKTLNSSPRTILYIEDDAASRSLVERTLRHAGYRVLVAERGLEGIDLARREEPDLILTDINLPDLTGREITTMLRSEIRFQRTPIVALTAQVLRDQREMAMAAGLTGYLTKPLDVEALPGQVEYYLSGGQDIIDSTALNEAHTRYAQEIVLKLEGRIRELETLNAELRRLDRMKDTFIQVTAHELRTPLTLVYGYSRLMEDNPNLGALMKQDSGTRMLVEGMGHAIGRMQSIINEILTVSRIITNRIDLSIGPTNMGDIVERVIQGYADALKQRNITVNFNKADWPERMRADWELMELVMRNLLSNAIKYTPDGGKVDLVARVENGDTLRFSVKDTGIGIRKDDLRTIFERFTSTSDPQFHSTSKTAFRGGGIGLGLAVSKGIIEAHGGHIWAESPGHDPEKCPGSEIIVVMPITAPGFAG
ncbi:MAG TPA: hybrid sensor histidine kinase/response regulator [Oceanobacillus sp.]|nr:hybrid sensor histidine kinase/response regulator [Oceanobacillus sp.]